MREVESIRTSLSPHTRTTIDEAGVILPGDNNIPPSPAFPTLYWVAAASGYAYLFAHLQALGVDVVGCSQLMGYPMLPDVLGGLTPQYSSVSHACPGHACTPRRGEHSRHVRPLTRCCLCAVVPPQVSMVNWTTGAGTARWWGLDLLTKEIHVGDHLMRTVTAGDGAVWGQGYVTQPGSVHKVLVINMKNAPSTVTVEGAKGGTAAIIDEESGEKPARREKLNSDDLTLRPFAFAILTLNSGSSDGRGARGAARVVAE